MAGIKHSLIFLVKILNSFELRIPFLINVAFYLYNGKLNSDFPYFNKELDFETEVCVLKDTSVHLVPLSKIFSPFHQHMCK